MTKAAFFLLLGVCFALSAGCTVDRIGYWAGSVREFPEGNCKVSDGDTACAVTGGITIAITAPWAYPIVAPAGLSLEIPVGHVVRLSSDAAAISLPDGSYGWTGRIVSTSGFRFKNMNSLERETDGYDDDTARDLVGSTFRARRSSEIINGIYAFEIQTKERYPNQFELQLPSIIVDGKVIAMPSVIFRYGMHTKVKGLFGV